MSDIKPRQIFLYDRMYDCASGRRWGLAFSSGRVPVNPLGCGMMYACVSGGVRTPLHAGTGPVPTLTWIISPYVLYGVKYIDLVSLAPV